MHAWPATGRRRPCRDRRVRHGAGGAFGSFREAAGGAPGRAPRARAGVDMAGCCTRVKAQAVFGASLPSSMKKERNPGLGRARR
eukprot:353790-Chlamydomonas_euryale.AAC.1